jgi:hypothetical protein
MIKWPKALIDKIARRDSVILIGSGVSANSIDLNGQRPPTWFDFLTRATNELETCPNYVKRALAQAKYLDASEYLKELHGSRWIELIRENFHAPQYAAADIHKHIFNLDSRVVGSLNFDRIYDTYATIQSSGTYIVKNYWDDDVGSVSSGPDKYLLKLRGSIDTPDKLLFPTKDYARARTENSIFYKVLDSLIVTHSFFIIGCGLNDPDIQMLFENYKFSYKLSDHYMMLTNPIHDRQKNLVRDSRGINILPYSGKNHHAELTDSLSELVQLVADRRETIASDQSW